MILIPRIFTAADFSFTSAASASESANRDQPLSSYQACDSTYDLAAVMDAQHAHVCGPVQDDEALLLFSLLKTLRPRYMLEIGVYDGVSTKIIAEALSGSEGGTLYAVDIHIKGSARSKLASYLQAGPSPWVLKLIEMDMLALTAAHLDHKMFDLIFLDASHIYSHYVQLFPFLQSVLSPNGILLTHDTGLHVNSTLLPTVCDGFMLANGCYCDGAGLCGFPHRMDNRRFVNWVLHSFPYWQVMHLHSFRRIRHGLTLMTRKRELGMDRHPDRDCHQMVEC